MPLANPLFFVVARKDLILSAASTERSILVREEDETGTHTEMSPAKILFIGIDALDKDLLLHWAAEGSLPVFRSLLDTGAWSITSNPVGLYVGAVWPSFFTAVSPARHRRYCYEQLRTGTYRTYPFSPFDIKAEPFWDALSRAGRRVAIIDVPKSFPSQQLNGIQLVDWGSHDRDLPFCTWPPSLAEEVAARFGDYPVHLCDGPRETPAEFRQLRDSLIAGIQKKTELIEHFLEQGNWDLFLTVFGEGQCVGHQCWHLHDSNHPRYDAELARSVGNPIKDVYIALDSAIGRIRSRIDSQSIVFVFTSHGMGPHYDGSFLLDAMLRALDSAELSAAPRRVARVLDWCWANTPDFLRQRLRPLRTQARQVLGEAVPLRDTSLRKCFPVPNNDVCGAIRINLIGREPQGRIAKGREYDTFVAELSSALLSFVNSDRNTPLVRRILRSRDYYQGEYFDDLPDLLVEWNREFPISTIHSPKTGTIRRDYRGTRTGDHTPDGLFVAVGPKVPRGPVKDDVSVMDLAPTIAAFLGVSLSRSDGKPIFGS